MNNENNTQFTDKKHEIIFQAKMNIYYHESKENFYSKFLENTTFITLILSSATISSFIADFNVLGFIFGITITILNAAVLSYGMLQKLMLHREFKRDWGDIINLSESKKSIDDLIIIDKKIVNLNTREPSPNTKLVKKSYEQTKIAMGL
jgi:hypothetical protein